MPTPLVKPTFLYLLLVASLAAGCSSSGASAEVPAALFEPAWIRGDSGSPSDGKGDPGFTAMGTASGVGNVRTLRDGAEKDARGRLRLDLEPCVRLAVWRYVESKAGRKEYGEEPDTRRIRSQVDEIVTQAAGAAQVMDYWITRDDRLCVLLGLTEPEFHASVKKTGRLSAGLRKALDDEGEKLFGKIRKSGLHDALREIKDLAIKAAL